MSVYHNATQNAAISRMEIDPVGAGNQAMLFLRDASAADEVRTLLKSSTIKQEIVSETNVNGSPVLITRGPLNKERLVSALSSGNQWNMETEKSPIGAWGWRAILGLAGQGLVFAGSFKKAAPGQSVLNKEQLTFALANIAANFIAIGYGASSAQDPHQLHYLKQEVNNELIGLLDSDKVLSATDNRSALRANHTPKGPFRQLNDVMKKHSSQISIGLRYFGAINLAKTGLPESERKLGNLLKPGKVVDKTRYGAGLAVLAGKTTALSGRIEDPYNPAPSSQWDKLREKFFVGGGLLEAGGFGSLAVMNAMKKEPENRFFAAGNVLFVLAYIIRTQAKLGVRKLDMTELYAHVADSVARLPEEERTQAIADISGVLQTHFSTEKNITLSEIYAGIMDDLHKNHPVSAQSQSAEPEQDTPEPATSQPAPHILADGATHSRDTLPQHAQEASLHA